MFILNPDFEIVSAPIGSTYYLKFKQIESAISYVVFRATDIAILEENYQRYKTTIETYDFTNPTIVGTNGPINNKEDLFIHLQETIEKIDHITTDTFVDNNLGLEGYGQNFIVGIFAIFDSTFNVYDGVNIVEKENLKCSLYQTKKIQTHTADPLLSGRINTNNKLSRWSWANELYEDYDNLRFEVSIWRGDHIEFDTQDDNWFCNDLINIKTTTDDFFVFAEYVDDLRNGGYSLIVNALNDEGAISEPASYNFFIKTGIEDDLSIRIISQEGLDTNTVNTRLPSFRLSNFNSVFDYKFTFNGDENFSYLFSEMTSYIISDDGNTLTASVDDELEYGFNTLTVEKIDELGNTTGSGTNSPRGIYGGSYISFVINRDLVETPQLLGYQFIGTNQVMISWEAEEGIRDFMVYQGGDLIKQSRDSFVIYTPTFNTTEDTIVNVYSYDYFGNRSRLPLSVNINTIINRISSLTISCPDSIWIDNKEYVNNPSPSFSWISNDSSTEDIISYKISLDGSNWKHITVNFYTFLENLPDNDYTFRVIPIYKTNKEGNQYFYNFKLNTKNPSTPRFDSKTLSTPYLKKSDGIISWLEVLNAYRYEIAFNESFVDENTSFISIDGLSINLLDYEEALFGLNTVSLRTVDNYGNKSNINRLSFYIEQEDEEIEEETVISLFPPSNLNKDIICSTDKFHTIDTDYVSADCIKVIVTVRNKYGLEIEFFESIYPLIDFTNSTYFIIEGLYTFHTQWLDDRDNVLSEKIDTFVYSETKTQISSMNFLNGVVTWGLTTPDPDSYTFTYSISNTDNSFDGYIETDSRSLDLKDNLLPGTYFININCYSKINYFLNDTNKLQFIIIDNNYDNYGLIAIPGNPGKFLEIIASPSSNSFTILNVTDSEKLPLDGFLEYKSSLDINFNLYQSNLLNLDENYSFIFNETSGGV